jgi:LmbE family N-acetylglucosaminyl deacetylase
VRPLLAFFAHPDDETFCAAGLFAAATERGVPVTVVSATRGEAGESSIPGLDDPASLGEVREQELRDAMRHVGVQDVRFLGYHDSGLGDPETWDPLAFARLTVEKGIADLLPLVREIRPDVVVTFGPDGMYGHPDHLHTYSIAVEAVKAAADPSYQSQPNLTPWQCHGLYFATIPREEMQELLRRPNSPLAFLSPEARANLGTPRAEITHVLDITPWAVPKAAAIAAHQTQTGEGGPLAEIPQDLRARQLAREYFVRALLPWPSPPDSRDIVEVLTEFPTSR